MKRLGYHGQGTAIDSGVDYSPAHLRRAVGVSNKLRGKFTERTNRTANLRGYRARKARLLWIKLKAGALDERTAAAIARDYKVEFARFARAEVKQLNAHHEH